MNPIVNLKWVKSHKQQKRTIYSIGKIESGLSYNLTKKLAEGVSISNKMIQTEISKSKSLKKTIKKLKKDLKRLVSRLGPGVSPAFNKGKRNCEIPEAR